MKIEEKVGNKDFVDYLETQRGAAKSLRTSHEPQWKSINTFMAPRRSRFEESDTDKGDRRWNAIINNIATKALRTATAGMLAGSMSPARPWFALSLLDPAIMERADVRLWLHGVEQVILAVLRTGNFYQTAQLVLKELLLYGTACMTHVDDFDAVAWFYQEPLGSFYIGIDEKLNTNRLIREFQWTVDNTVSKFGLENVSSQVKNAYDRGDHLQKVDIVHHIQPNNILDLTSPFARGKPYIGAYYEKGTPGQKQSSTELLGLEGFFERPFYAPRWETTGTDVYGTECPGIIALGDTRQLQGQERRKAQAIEKMADPPLQGPSGLAGGEVVNLPGGLTIYDIGNDNKGIRKLYDVDLSVQELRLDADAVERRIDDAFFVSLFLAISQMEGIQPRNELDLTLRNDEKLLQLGPVLQNIHGDLLNLVITRTFNQLVRGGAIPPAPDIIREQQLEVQYVSSLAQAQRAVATQGVDRVMNFALGVVAGGGDPTILDNLDTDWAVGEYSRLVGTSLAAITEGQDG